MSSQENITDTASSQLPPSGFSGPDDIPRKTNGAPIKTIDRGSDIMPRGLPQPPSKPQVLSTPSPSAAMAPSRAGTLSWQQRPSSRGSMGPSKRPLSMKASESNASISPSAAVDRTSTTDDDVEEPDFAVSRIKRACLVQADAGSRVWIRSIQEEPGRFIRYSSDDGEQTVAGNVEREHGRI